MSLMVNVFLDVSTMTCDLVVWTHGPNGPHRVTTLEMKPDQARTLALSLVTTADQLDKFTKPQRKASALQVKKAGDLWTYDCAEHPHEGYGLWHEQIQAYAAACEHYTNHH